MDRTKNVRIKFSREHLLLIQKAIEEYIQYSKTQNYQHSIDRMSPVFDYLQKKLKSTKTETISLQLSLDYIGSIHDAVSDYALFYENKTELLIEIVEYIEETMKKKFNTTNYRTLNISTRTSFDVKKELKKKAL